MIIFFFLGTVLVEAKSGYGLDPENEMKMLRVLERARRELPIDVSSTFCGAHAVPKSLITFFSLSIFFLFSYKSNFVRYRGKTSEEATENVLKEQLPELIRMRDSGQIHVDSKQIDKLITLIRSLNECQYE